MFVEWFTNQKSGFLWMLKGHPLSGFESWMKFKKTSGIQTFHFIFADFVN